MASLPPPPSPSRDSSRDPARDPALESLATATGAVLWFADAAGRASDDNAAWAAFTGQSAKALSGWGWLDAIHPDDRASVKSVWQPHPPQSASLAFQFRLRRHDGAMRHMAVRASCVRVDGKPAQWTGICVDITERLQA